MSTYDDYIARDPREADPDAVRDPEPEPVPTCQRCGGDQDVIAGLCDVCADTVGKRRETR